MPHIVDPQSGRLWSANNRVLSGEALALVGDGGYAPSHRAKQIRDALLALEDVTPGDLLHLQLDDRGLYLEPWRDFVLHQVLTPQAIEGHPQRAAARRLIEAWEGRAATDSAGYRVLRGFRQQLTDHLGDSLTPACRAVDKNFDYTGIYFRFETPLWAVITGRPQHLLDPAYDSWDAYFLAAMDEVTGILTRDGKALDQAVWGQVNTARIRHPLSRAVPQLASWLDMPPDQLPGDSSMPRVQHPTFGASERMVVSPGREGEGFLHMPGGQSGNPLSPHYRDGHAAWVKGEPTPFLPGATEHQLRLVPGDG